MLARRARGRPLRFLIRKIFDLGRQRCRTLLTFAGINPYKVGRQPARLRLKLITDSSAIERAITLVKRDSPAEITELIDRADRLMSGDVTVFGHTVRLDGERLWHTDQLSGFTWPQRFHHRYRYSDLIDLGRASDIKLPWELSRLQFLPSLALAYRVTGDDRYVKRARAIFDDWFASNPVGYGVPWAIGMEAALRAISLLWTAEILDDTPAAKIFLSQQVVESLVEHGRYLVRNIEYSDINGNHYTACLLGLLYLGVALDGVPEAQKWRDTAIKELSDEIVRQTYSDGVCHEGSVPYHRLVTELFLHAYLLARRVGVDLGTEYPSRLERMLDFVAAYIKPSGMAPVVGDADDGRVHAFGSQDVNDHRYLLAIGSALFGRADLRAQAGKLGLDAAVLLDSELLDAYERISVGEPTVSSAAFPEGGFWLLRSGGGYVLVDCGDVGLRGRGGHGHNDALSVELTLGGLDVLTDSGCASYTRDVAERCASISASAHNVALLDEKEPAPLSFDRIPSATACPAEAVFWDAARPVFVGRHYGFRGSADRYVYERGVTLDENGTSCLVRDSFVASGEHIADWYFHFAVDWVDATNEEGRILLARGDSPHRVVLEWDAEHGSARLFRSNYYGSYGCRSERWAVVIRTQFKDRVAIEFRFRLLSAVGASQDA